MNYRFHGAQKTISFGRWPEVTLADSREKTLQARRRLADGIDPCEQKKLDRIAASIAQANTFKAVSDDWLEKVGLEARAPMTIKKCEWQLGLVMPSLGRRPITQITPHEVLLALKRIERTKKYYAALSFPSPFSPDFRHALATRSEEPR